MTTNNSLLNILHVYAQSHGDSIAHLLPDRVITYRRLWSRIERASARLQGEWGVASGDSVIYWGLGHPDAFILFCALLRIGAKLVPCEDSDYEHVQRMVQQTTSHLVMHDDALTYTTSPAHSLSSLLADWCHFNPVIVEGNSSEQDVLLTTQNQHNIETVNISQIIQNIGANPQSDALQLEPVVVDGPIFRKENFIQIILPALLARRHLRFSILEHFSRVS